MRSGNRSTFKKMGSSSPVRDTSTRTPHGHDHDDQGNEIKWSNERLISEKQKETDVDVTETRQYETKGTSKGKPVEKIDIDFGKPGSDICKEAARAGVPCAEYIKKKEIELGYTKEHTKGRTEEDVTPKEKKKCNCMAYNAAGEETGLVHYDCDWEGLLHGKHPNCFKRPTGSLCECTDPQGKKHSYPCKSKNCSDCPEPKICEGKKLKCDMTSTEMKAARQKCKEMGTVVSRAVKARHYWSNSQCKCVKKSSKGKEVVKDAYKCLKSGFRTDGQGNPTQIPCSGVDGGIRTSMN